MSFLHSSCKRITPLSYCRTNFKNKEALGISNVVRKLQLFFGHSFSKLPQALYESYLDEITRITCCFAEGAELEEAVRTSKMKITIVSAFFFSNYWMINSM